MRIFRATGEELDDVDEPVDVQAHIGHDRWRDEVLLWLETDAWAEEAAALAEASAEGDIFLTPGIREADVTYRRWTSPERRSRRTPPP